MAVMTSSAFDKVPLEAKAISYPVEPMALDHEANGVSDKFDGLFDEPDLLDAPQSVMADSPPSPTTNGNHTEEAVTSTPTIEPITNVSSGIEPVAHFLPQPGNDASTALDGEGLNATSVVSAVEAPTSGIREEPDSNAVAPSSDKSSLEQAAADAPLQTVEEFVGGDAAIDTMDVSQDLPDAPALADSAPAHKTETPSQPPPGSYTELQDGITHSPTTMDQEMPDAPDAPVSGKVRAREEDDEGGAPEPKRQKTDESLDARPEFKVPEVPAPHEQPVRNGTSVPPTGDESAVQTAVHYDQWPTTEITSAQSRFLLERVRITKKIKAAFAFKEPVNPEALNIPHYRDFIKQPMDLSTMEDKLRSHQYTSVLDFMRDLDLIIDNSVTFNSKDHPITQAGYNMRAYFLKGMNKMPKEGVPEPPKPTKQKKLGLATSTKPRRESRTSTVTAKSPTGSAVTAASPQTPWPLNSDGLPLIRRDSSSANDRPKREIHRPPPRDLPYNSVKPKKKKYQQELRFCESVIAEMLKPKYTKFSYPFLKPVDPVALNIPQYLKIIKKPMDLGTIDKNMREGQYQSAKDFYSDMLLVFNNCYKFNPETDDVHKMGKQLHDLFNSLWSEKSIWLAEHAPASDPQSPASVYDEEEDEEEEEEDPAQDQILAIQKQIQELNETAKALLEQKTKRTSPKVPGKKGAKSSKPAKPKKTSTLVPPPKTATRPKPKPKAPAPLSFAQKEEISVGISTLGDADMRKAVQIIRNGCPHLASVNDDEMEIDMDEISDDTLRELLRFIKSVKSTRDVADEEYVEPKPVRTQSTNTKKKNKPMGKKEQEENIKKIQQQLTRFQASGSGSSQSPPAQDSGESSGDEDSGSESEEE